MTSEEAKCYIRTLLEVGGCDGFDYKQKEALDMAITALEDKGYEQGYADGWAECLAKCIDT